MSLRTLLSDRLAGGQWLGLLAIFAAPSAGAVIQEINALFTPDSANPQSNKFVNKTPASGYCADHPDQCSSNNIFSIRLPVRFDSGQALQPAASARNSAMFKVPADWRALTVTNAQTGESERVEVRIAGIGSQYHLSDTVVRLTGASSVLEGHQRLWTGGTVGSWVYAAPPCEYSGVGWYGERYYRFFWKTPIQGSCVKTANFRIPAMTYEYLDFAYELRTPNPLGMSSGLYSGHYVYTIGPGGEFDMGDVMLPNDSSLTLNFNLDVQHTLKVDIPPGGDKVQLVPAGGWQSWLDAGRRPVRLFRDQSFNISASSRFRMLLECERAVLFNCAIFDSVSGREAVVQVGVSLPNGLTDTAGQPVNRQPLRIGLGAERQVYQPGFYVDRAPGTLHFEMSPFYVSQIVQSGVAARYVGNITVIWDSEI